MVSLWVNTKCRFHSLATLFPPISGGVKAHFLAACRAISAKYLLGPGESNSASDTVPAGSTCTLMPTRTLPRIVSRAFCDTSGRIWSRTSPFAEPLPIVAGFAASSDTGLLVNAASGEGGSFSRVVFTALGAIGCAARLVACCVAGAEVLAVSETSGSSSGVTLGLDGTRDPPWRSVAGWPACLSVAIA